MANNNCFPDFIMEGVNEAEAFEVVDCENVVKSLIGMSERGEFEQFDISLNNVETPAKLRCNGYAIVERYVIMRLYIAYRHIGDDDTDLYTAYIVSNDDGVGLLVPEHDERMMEKVRNAMNASIVSDPSDYETAGVAPELQKRSRAGKVIMVIGCIILFPVWLLWQFVKALLSLFNIGFGDSSTVRAFKRGFSGTDDRKAYKFINDAGCEETLYSSDGKSFYRYDGSFAGTSDDGGKTLYQ